MEKLNYISIQQSHPLYFSLLQNYFCEKQIQILLKVFVEEMIETNFPSVGAVLSQEVHISLDFCHGQIRVSVFLSWLEEKDFVNVEIYVVRTFPNNVAFVSDPPKNTLLLIGPDMYLMIFSKNPSTQVEIIAKVSEACKIGIASFNDI